MENFSLHQHRGNYPRSDQRLTKRATVPMTRTEMAWTHAAHQHHQVLRLSSQTHLYGQTISYSAQKLEIVAENHAVVAIASRNCCPVHLCRSSSIACSAQVCRASRSPNSSSSIYTYVYVYVGVHVCLQFKRNAYSTHHVSVVLYSIIDSSK